LLDHDFYFFCFGCFFSNVYLHQDVEELMPENATAWAARNFLVNSEGHVYMTYWLNHLQNLGSTGLPYLVTMNPPQEPKHIVDKWQTSHLIPSLATAAAAKQLEGIQGKQGIWFCGAYQGIYLMCHINDAVF
jgi:cyclopropane-fatty-acyl-phospholipid synthase